MARLGAQLAYRVYSLPASAISLTTTIVNVCMRAPLTEANHPVTSS